MGRCARSAGRSRTRALRAGGGGSKSETFRAIVQAGSPRRRRWVAPHTTEWGGAGGLSAQAEVGRSCTRSPLSRSRALRAGGGGSIDIRRWTREDRGSPRRRRWVVVADAGCLLPGGLSAQAEVGRALVSPSSPEAGALRAGGGGSQRHVTLSRVCQGSPRRRRWVVPPEIVEKPALGLSAQAEVGQSSQATSSSSSRALRAGGGGSPPPPSQPRSVRGSPRRRRWVGSGARAGDQPGGLSAQAEVGRPLRWGRGRQGRALRAGGGGSTS